ncbi:uncharacterized protein LOC121837158 [Ixodes scapularis]|uniref:uncharacterized protein LOC121837158 n=1 Tax=Ixodes scapularis TaxID=6945 RepID=UPI001C38ED6C|nr:uncharacterized protein LOC121837158 [Ixodes scapularis]
MMINPPSPKNSSAPPPPLTVWQWNCRSFRNKKPSLTLLALQHSPDLIALQETNTDNVSLRGYTTYATDPTSRTAVLVQATQTAQTHTLPTTIDYTFVELLPRKKTEPSLYVLNIYSPPTQTLSAIDRLLRIVRQRTRGHKLVVLGDFNAQHTAWGYPRNNKKGTSLHEATLQNQLYLYNSLHIPTRIGNSVSQDTTPDLTFTYNIKQATWSRLDKTLGSDHYIIQLQIPHQRTRSQKIGTARITNWKNFREATPTGPIISLEDWTTQLLEKARENTKELSLTEDNPAIDAHLLHLWDARNGLLRRWRKNKTNRKLKTRIAKLTAEAETYALQLSQLNWMQLCNKIQGTLGTRRTWHLLRSLLGTGESKAVTTHQLRRLIHNHPARRLARANTHAKLYPPSPCTLYTDATPYSHKPAHCVTVRGQQPPPNVTAATILPTNTTTAEGTAIAFALAQSPTPQFVLSDPQQAISNFIRGNISPMAFQILTNNPPSDTVTLLWTPTHTGVDANEMVHDRARELIDRAAISTTPTRDAPADKPISLL